jgi:hypothetical protein
LRKVDPQLPAPHIYFGDRLVELILEENIPVLLFIMKSIEIIQQETLWLLLRAILRLQIILLGQNEETLNRSLLRYLEALVKVAIIMSNVSTVRSREITGIEIGDCLRRGAGIYKDASLVVFCNFIYPLKED